MRCHLFYTCRPAGAWVHGVVAFLHTFRAAGALKGWFTVRILRAMVGRGVLWDFYGSSIAVANRSFDPSLFAQLITYYPFA